MNKGEFLFSLVEGGFTKEECIDIEQVIEWANDRTPQHVSDLRDAAREYLMICRDISKLRGFLRLVDEMNRCYAVSWKDATHFVLKVVCGCRRELK